MSFLRHGQIYQSDLFFVSDRKRTPYRLRPRSHRLDEFAASYSLAGWSPPEPTSASPAGSIFNPPAETVNHLRRRVGDFSTGTMGNFQPVLTGVLDQIGIRAGPHDEAIRGLNAVISVLLVTTSAVERLYLPFTIR